MVLLEGQETSFATLLSLGTLGVRVNFPDSFAKVSEGPLGVTFDDPSNGVRWHAYMSMFRIDLREQHLPLLRRQAEREARAIFDHFLKSEGLQSTPRSADPSWSPIISLDRLHVDGASVLQIIHRLTYCPGSEIVAGRLIIPIAEGGCTIEITASYAASFTGVRESFFTATHIPKILGDRMPTPEALQQIVSTIQQADIDDPALDSQAPDSPLSVVRRALLWLKDPQGAGLRVTADPPTYQDGEVEIPHASCAVTPPPRYLPLSQGTHGLDPTIGQFSQVGLSTDSPRGLAIWKYTKQRLNSKYRAEALRTLAIQTAEEWAAEGVTDILAESSPLADRAGLPVLACAIQAVVNGKKMQEGQCWAVEADGQVFRVGITDDAAPMQELLTEAEAVMRTLRYIPTQTKRWWHFWK